MTFLTKKPVILALLLALVAFSSFAVSYSVMTVQMSGNASSSSFAVIGGSCCEIDGTCALEANAQTVAAKEETLDACCELETTALQADLTASLDACCALEGAVTADAGTSSQTQFASVE